MKDSIPQDIFELIFSCNNIHTKEQLIKLQSLTLKEKIEATKVRIIEWYNHYNGGVYVSFSGGKDSTVLLHLVRSLYPEVPAVFCDTGLEYPEIREFVNTFENVDWVYPSLWNRKKREYDRVSFKDVIEKYGYPVISKEQSQFIYEYRTTKSEKLKNIRWNGNKWGMGKISKKWRKLIDAPFKVSNKCCTVMKKTPSTLYEKHTGRKPYIGTMATESILRQSQWVINGCNAYDKNRPTSQPLSFWSENDIFEYIATYNIPYCDLYGDIYYDVESKTYKNTGLDRTGCIFCMFGCHLEDEPNRFQKLKKSHPKLYDYCMRSWEDGGLGIGKVLDYIGVPYS